jgi:hypothetical protein
VSRSPLRPVERAYQAREESIRTESLDQLADWIADARAALRHADESASLDHAADLRLYARRCIEHAHGIIGTARPAAH